MSSKDDFNVAEANGRNHLTTFGWNMESHRCTDTGYVNKRPIDRGMWRTWLVRRRKSGAEVCSTPNQREPNATSYLHHQLKGRDFLNQWAHAPLLS